MTTTTLSEKRRMYGLPVGWHPFEPRQWNHHREEQVELGVRGDIETDILAGRPPAIAASSRGQALEQTLAASGPPNGAGTPGTLPSPSGTNRVGDPAHADRHAMLRERLEQWMRETRDPLLAGHVDPPPGVEITLPDQRSAADPTTRVG